jgi:RNA polymerase sigma factor (sigma-70 family)
MEVLEKPIKSTLSREIDFPQLYEDVFPVCAQWVRNMKGSLTDAEDIFQDALVIYYEKGNNSMVTLTASPEAYIIGIVKHLWIKKFNKDASLISLNDLEKSLSIPENFYPSINTLRLLEFLENTGRNCLELLQSFYYEKLSMREISTRMGFGSERSATVQKYKCIEKLRMSVKQKLLSYEDFTE